MDNHPEEAGQAVDIDTPEQAEYEAPRVTVMDEAEVLKAFQFTSAAISWWVM